MNQNNIIDAFTKAKCLTRQAYTLVSCGLLDQALETYNDSIELNPSDFEAVAGRALLHLKKEILPKH